MDQTRVDPIAIQIILKLLHSFAVATVAGFVAWCLHRIYDSSDRQTANKAFPFTVLINIMADREALRNLVSRRAEEVHRKRITNGATGDEVGDWLKAETDILESIEQAAQGRSQNSNDDHPETILIFLEKWSSIVTLGVYLVVKLVKNFIQWTSSS